MNDVVIEKVSIGNPIGNLYRKSHVLVLVVDNEGDFILGKKKDFYPSHIARMLGGGVKEGEDPLSAAKREISEELQIDIPVSEFQSLGAVVTQASTNEADMEMKTWIYAVKLPSLAEIKPSDDISGVKVYTPEQYAVLVDDMLNLSGEFVTEKFSFLWADWGKIYGPLHRHAMEAYLRLKGD